MHYRHQQSSLVWPKNERVFVWIEKVRIFGLNIHHHLAARYHELDLLRKKNLYQSITATNFELVRQKTSVSRGGVSYHPSTRENIKMVKIALDDVNSSGDTLSDACSSFERSTWKKMSVGYLMALTVWRAILSKKVKGAWCFFRSIDRLALYVSHGCTQNQSIHRPHSRRYIQS